MIVGELELDNSKYHFYIENDTMKMDPVKIEKPNLLIQLSNFEKPNVIECDYLLGKCYPDGHEIIIVPKNRFINIKGNTWTIELDFLFEFKNEVEPVSKINFMIKEIDYIYNVNMSIKTEKPFHNPDGSMEISLKPYNETISEKQEFNIGNKEVICYFNIGKYFSFGGNEPPINIYSYLCFEFEETNDYDFLIRLYLVAKRFIQYLCYRENILIKKTTILGKDEISFFEGGHIECFRNNNITEENDKISRERFIPYNCIKNSFGHMLQDIVDERIYTRHIPKSYSDSKQITPARFVLIMAAFEWEFNKKYPEGLQHSESTLRARENVTKHFQEMISSTSGKEKEIYQRLIKRIDDDNLEGKVALTGKEYDEIVGVFGKYLYGLNKREMNYRKIGERLSKQRNNYAHGNLDEEFIGDSVLDLIFMEKILYALQLSRYITEKSTIQKAINFLFGHMLALKEKNTSV